MLESFKRFLSSKGKVREGCQNVIRQYIVGVIRTIKEKITGLKFFMFFSVHIPFTQLHLTQPVLLTHPTLTLKFLDMKLGWVLKDKNPIVR